MEIDGGRLELDSVQVDGSGILSLSHILITSVSSVQKLSIPLSLDEAKISGGTVNLERIRIVTGQGQSEPTWNGGREEARIHFLASFRKPDLVDGKISFNDVKIPFGKFFFNGANFTGGVLDFENSRLEDCCLDFTGAEINGGCLNFSNSFIGVNPLEFKRWERHPA